MRDIYRRAGSEEGLSPEEIRKALLESLEGRRLGKVLILPPDFTRYHSNAGFITNVYYHVLTERGVRVDILPALGTHGPVSKEQWEAMFGDIPYEIMLEHNWRTDVVRLGEVPGAYIAGITDGLWTDPDATAECVDREDRTDAADPYESIRELARFVHELRKTLGAYTGISRYEAHYPLLYF